MNPLHDLLTRLLRRLTGTPAGDVLALPAAPYAPWLTPPQRAWLADAEARLQAGASVYSVFSGLHDDDLWTLLLFANVDGYPVVRSALPAVPDAALQTAWVGRSGLPLAVQTRDFYQRLKTICGVWGTVPLAQAHVLDFGCGWGRILRCFLRDVPAGQLHGCDPDADILATCAALRVPGDLRQSDFVPQALPFGTPFDLIYAFSVFTHLSERAHLACLNAIHRGLAPGGLAVVTVRPAAYARLDARLTPHLAEILAAEAQGTAGYFFVPHHRAPVDGEVTYGDTVITDGYIRQHWAPLFDIVDTQMILSDIHQQIYVLRRR